jgi:phosphopantetheinyl transferase
MNNGATAPAAGGAVDLCLVRLEVGDEAAPNRVPAALFRPGEKGRSLRNACYACLFELLHRRAGLSLADFMLRMQRDAFGRPRLPSGLGHLHFSVSHADTSGLVAVSDAPVGVDIERIDACYADTLREFFDQSCLVDGNGDDEGLFIAWAAYESVAKLLGLGLRLDVADLRKAHGQVFAADHAVEIVGLPAPAGHVAALACLSPAPTLRWTQMPRAPHTSFASTGAHAARAQRVH